MKDGQPLMTFGNMGGSVQPETHAQHMVNLIDLGMNVQMTTDAARFTHNQNSNVLSLEAQPVQPGRRRAARRRATTSRSVNGGAVGGYQGILFTRDPRLPEPVFDRAPPPRICRSTASIAPDRITARTVRRSAGEMTETGTDRLLIGGSDVRKDGWRSGTSRPEGLRYECHAESVP